jgi:mitogen-activated protein kinase 15
MTEHIESHILSKFKIVKKVGSGAYGHVWKVIDNKDGKTKALKKNFDAFNNSTDAQRTYREIMFLL